MRRGQRCSRGWDRVDCDCEWLCWGRRGERFGVWEWTDTMLGCTRVSDVGSGDCLGFVAGGYIPAVLKRLLSRLYGA